jgi:hypothetical protein
VAIQQSRQAARELQAEAIIGAGFTRFLPAVKPTTLPQWSVRRTATGLELWDHGGIWARADLAVDLAWQAAADAAGAVLAIYGVNTGARCPTHVAVTDYTDAKRAEELSTSRSQGVVAAALVPWTS